MTRAFALLAATLFAVTAYAVPDVAADAGTVFLLRADASRGALVDTTGRFEPVVNGGAVIADALWGACLELGEGEKNGITIRDEGRIRFEDGMTLDAWVFFEEALPVKGASLALKPGSFSWDLLKGKLNTAWMVFPSEEIFTTTPPQFKYYPVGGDTINGLMNVPLQKWTRLTMAYDEALGVVTTSIDGMTDRRRFRYRGPQRLQSDGRSPLTLLQGFKQVRIGALQLRSGRPHLSPPTLEVFANALPYQDKVMLTFDHIDPDLPLPIEVAIIWEKPSGSAETLRTFALAAHARQDVLLDAPTWKDSLHTIQVNATAGGRAVFSKNFRVANVKPAGRVMVNADHTLSRDGKKFFPLLMYHAMPEHFAQMAELGINTVLNDFCLNRANPQDRAGYARDLVAVLDGAAQHHLGVIVSANAAFGKLFTIAEAKAHPALLAWYGDDEPWGDLTRLHESYNTIKMLAPDPPVLIVQNNYSRLQDTAPAADIIATDPYPVPNVSLRAVVDATQAARRAVAGNKPVWTVLPQYGAKVPTREELRCMAWLAIASGANGLGFFTWDERIRDPQTGALKGWFTPEHPEQVEDLRVVLQELRSLEPVLLAPSADKQPTMNPANPALHALIKTAEGHRWLLLANDSRRAEETTLQLPDIENGESSALTGGSAPLIIRGGNAPVSMSPLGVAVYQLIP
ncbi:MAG: hypothetical protein ABJF10_19265 [Chthoniobacter sp.]|uniref:hypothetical protein n=1 Tax=Chthoniobacter sp. TaxID=2510640 RepID=UPI0032AE453B